MPENIPEIILSVKTGIVDPTTVTPDFTGQLYLNTATDQLFFARSTTIGDYEEILDVTSGSGDMLKSVYDIDDNGIVDNSENLNDGSSGGGNNVTASEARSHIDDTNNPHNVQANQVPTDESGSTVQSELDDLEFDSHVQNTDTKLDDGQPNEVTSADLRSHLDDITSNPHNVEANDINTNQSGQTVQDALDDLETDSHTHANKAELDLVTDGDHDVRTDNPHNVEANQIGTDQSGTTVQSQLDDLQLDSHTQNTDIKLDDGQPNEVTSAEIRTHIDDVTTNPHDVQADQIGTDQSGTTVQSQLDDLQLDSHTQNTDIKLDDGQPNEVTSAEIRTHIDDVTTNPHDVQADQIGTDQSGTTVQSQLDDLQLDSHTQNTDIKLDDGQPNEVTSAEIRTHIDDVTTNPHDVQADQIGTDQSGTTVQSQLDDLNLDSHVQGTDQTLDFGGVNQKSALQIKTHLDDILTNPHAVTKTQVGLSNVTNDAQLKRSANDLNTFPVKAMPVGDDVLILEDSADSFNKKKATITSLNQGITKGRFFLINANAGTTRGDYNTVSVSQNASINLSFQIPHDFVSLMSLELIFIPGATLTTENVTLNSDYALPGESITQNSQTVVATAIPSTADFISAKSIANAYSSLVANHVCGLHWNNNGIGTSLYVVGIRLRYT